MKGTENLKSQVKRLANFITSEIPGEPSQSEGAIDTAIRIMARQKVLIENRPVVDMDFIHGWRNNIRYALEIHQGYCQAREYDWDTNLDKSLITMLEEAGVEIKEGK